MDLRRIVIALWILAALALVGMGWRMAFEPLPAPEREQFEGLHTSPVVSGPGGHAYRYVAARGIAWDAARAAAQAQVWHGQHGYLATITSKAELDFVAANVFSRGGYADVTYLGGRQTAPREWRWVTGPEGRADGGRGLLFWTGDEDGQVQNGLFANWQGPAFQHGGRWDARKVCCVTLFSYGLPQFSTSAGDGYWEEGVAGYLVEWSDTAKSLAPGMLP